LAAEQTSACGAGGGGGLPVRHAVAWRLAGSGNGWSAENFIQQLAGTHVAARHRGSAWHFAQQSAASADGTPGRPSPPKSWFGTKRHCWGSAGDTAAAAGGGCGTTLHSTRTAANQERAR
jgi:hypothetical protein